MEINPTKPISLIANFSTSDGRLTRRKKYHGFLVEVLDYMSIDGKTGLRYLIFDDQREWMTFNLNALKVEGNPL